MTSLPTPREILTSLIKTLAAYDPTTNQQPPSNQHQHHSHNYSRNQLSNPLKLIPNSHRALLSTLHVLYPSTLLPALDLLDRNLVTRVVITSPAATSPNNGDDMGSEANPERPRRTFHIVRSAQAQPASRRRHNNHNHATTINNPSISTILDDATYSTAIGMTSTSAGSGGGGGGGKVYVVRLDAWNCSCAAFAFSAFPSEGSMFTRKRQEQQQQQRERSPCADDDGADNEKDEVGMQYPGEGRNVTVTTSREKSGYDILPTRTHNDYAADDNDEYWSRALECGGLSIDGLPDSGIPSVPCCKHLLACLLGERWSSVLGGFVQERTVGREEGAGLMANI